MQSLLYTLGRFNDYIRGGSSKELEKHMEYYNDRPKLLKRDFHRLKIGSPEGINEDIKEYLQPILENLNIPIAHLEIDPRTKKRVFDSNLTVYDFLLQLARDGHPQVDYIIDLIDDKTRFTKLELALGGSVIFFLLTYLLTLPIFQFAVDGLKALFSSLRVLPVMGLIYSLGFFAYYFIDSYYDKKKTEDNRTRDCLFLLGSSGIAIIAYSLLIATAAMMSSIIAGLFVAAACIDVIKEITCLYQEYVQEPKKATASKNQEFIIERGKARETYAHTKRRHALYINLGIALSLAAITALWCFLPGGLVVSIFAFSAMACVYYLKGALLRWNDSRRREDLQLNLQEIENKEIAKSMKEASQLKPSSEFTKGKKKSNAAEYYAAEYYGRFSQVRAGSINTSGSKVYDAYMKTTFRPFTVSSTNSYKDDNSPIKTLKFFNESNDKTDTDDEDELLSLQ